MSTIDLFAYDSAVIQWGDISEGAFDHEEIKTFLGKEKIFNLFKSTYSWIKFGNSILSDNYVAGGSLREWFDSYLWPNFSPFGANSVLFRYYNEREFSFHEEFFRGVGNSSNWLVSSALVSQEQYDELQVSAQL
jgi:hypothetical protein